MTTQSDRIKNAQRRAAESASQPQPAPVQTAPVQQPSGGFGGGFGQQQPQMDQNVVMHSNGELRVVPNERSTHMRAKMAGEGNVRDHDPERARAEANQGDQRVYNQAGARNARPYQPEGSQNVRTQGVRPQSGTRGQQPHIRDHGAQVSARAGEGNVQQSRQSVQDANFRTSPGVAGRSTPMAPTPIPGQRMPAGNAPQRSQQAPQPQAQPVVQPNPTPGPQGPVPFAVGPSPQNQNVADLTVLVATYRRPHLFRPQLQTLADQSLRAAELMVWSNNWGQGAEYHDHEAEAHFTFNRCKVNMGPWVRFSFALEAGTKYVLILDDDCFPGPRWIEAAIRRLEEFESQGELAVICGEGRIFRSDDPSDFAHFGPLNRPQEELLIDEGVKSWLIPRSLIETINSMPRPPCPVGWGLQIAAALYHANVFQFVLPYVETDRTAWGSIAMPADQPPVSVSATLPRYNEARAIAWDFYRSTDMGGWLPLALVSSDEPEDQPEASEPSASGEASADSEAVTAPG